MNDTSKKRGMLKTEEEATGADPSRQESTTQAASLMDPRTVFPEQFAWKEWWTPARKGRSWFFHTPRQMVAPPSHTVEFETLDTGVSGTGGKAARNERPDLAFL